MLRLIIYIYIKISYFLQKLLYWLMLRSRKIIFFIYYSNILFRLINLIYEEMWDDYYLFRRNFSHIKSIYIKQSIIKHIFLLFFFFAGVIPLFFFFIFSFFLLKYILKYIFFLLDFIIYQNNDPEDERFSHDYYIYYNKIKYLIIIFFEYVPYYIKRVYSFIFKSRWTAYFISLFIKFLKNKRDRIIKYFINKLDYFVLVYIPRVFDKLMSNNLHDIRIDIIIYFYKAKKILLVMLPWSFKKLYVYIYNIFYYKVYKNIFWKNYRYYILWRFYVLKVIYLKMRRILSDIYYYFLYKYYHIKFYWIWLYKVYFRSYACFMTIEAFFHITYFNCISYSTYLPMHIWQSFCYIILFRLYVIRRKIFKRFYYYKCLKYYLNKLKIEQLDIFKNYISHKYSNIWYYRNMWAFYAWYKVILNFFEQLDDFKLEFWLLEFGDKSQTWWNIVLYDVVVRFFVRAYVTTSYWYKFKFVKIVCLMRFNWYYGLISEWAIDGIKFHLWRKIRWL